MWNYDNAGNWSSTTVASTSSSISPSNTRNHSVSDQITSIAGNAATHDAKGNLTEYEINTKQYNVDYDLDNRIIKVDVNNTDVEYRYDALGRRTIRKEGSTQTALLWWRNSECAEYEHAAGQSAIQNDIMSHPTRLNAVIARAVDGSKFDLEWYHKNYLDHVYAVSDDTGNLDEHYRYSAFGEATIYNGSGNIQTSTQINNTITWNTRRLDTVSGYYLYKYRHYDPALGRWPSRDPIEEDGGVNLYAFVGNSSLNMFDLHGMKEKLFDPEKDKPKKICPGTETPADRSKDPKTHTDAYNCHSYSWHDSKGDPTDPGNKVVPPKWDDNPSDDMKDATKLGNDEKNKVGDVIVYGNDNNKDGKLNKDEILHSATVVEVDAEGNTTRASSKEGEGCITEHHPSKANTSYGSFKEWYRKVPPVKPNPVSPPK